MRKRKRFLIATVIVLAGCVGTDFIDDPITFVPARITISPNATAIQVGNTVSFQGTYYDSLGNSVAVTAFQWTSSNPAIAAVDANGLALGKQPGQVRIVASARGVSSDPALLTVVADPNQVARVAVTPDSGKIRVGGTLQFTAVARNLNGDAIAGKTFTWRSSDPTVAGINNNGLATAIKPGRVNIVATADGVDSSPARLEVLGQSRTGMFTRRPGTSYSVSGTATLEQRSDGSLILSFGNDFACSNGPGLEVFLSTTNVVSPSSRNLGRLQRTSGAQSYNVPAGVTLTSYNWVIIHCVPFNVTFGYAQLQ
jgi:hypothetical protein